jgi:hypothetical protein
MTNDRLRASPPQNLVQVTRGSVQSPSEKRMGPMGLMGLMSPSQRTHKPHESHESHSSHPTPPNPIEDEDEDDRRGRWPICHLSSVICHLSFVCPAAYHRPDF